MTQSLLLQLARYNRWANAQLYGAALALPGETYRRTLPVFFGSLPATLNHLLVTDRIWLKRLTGTGDAPDRLDAILFEGRAALTRARLVEDARLLALVEDTENAAFGRGVTYNNMSGQPFEQPLADILLHVFNHQTHHRGQAHACLSMLAAAPPSLDMILFQRGFAAPDLAAVLESSVHP